MHEKDTKRKMRIGDVKPKLRTEDNKYKMHIEDTKHKMPNSQLMLRKERNKACIRHRT